MIETGQSLADPLPAVPLEILALQLASTRRIGRVERPFFIEVAGTPRAGKTTALTALAELLRASGVRVEVVSERALDCPMPDKRDPAFNVWTFCATLTQVLEAQYGNTDFVLIDRGLVDAACWMDWYRATGNLTTAEHRVIERFVLLRRWASVLGLVLVMTVEPAVAMARDTAGAKAPMPGQIMNDRTLDEFNGSLHRVHARLKRHIPLVEIDTSRAAPDDVLRAAMCSALKHFLPRSPAESVLVVPRSLVPDLPAGAGFVAPGATVERFLAAVHEYGTLVDRREAEAEPAYIQPIPLAYVAHGSRLLVLPRSGRNGPGGLDATHAIWVGGHVRETDGVGREAIRRGLLREIEEEIQLGGLPDPALVGLVLDEQGVLPRMHVGVVHRVFIDGLATESLPGELVDVDVLASRHGQLEPWSRSIVAEHLRPARVS